MRNLRKTAVLPALIGVAFASATVLACGDDAAPSQAPAPTSTSVLDPTPADAYTCQLLGNSDDIPNDPRISLQVVEGILPSAVAMSATLGLAPGPWIIAPYLGYKFALTFAGEDSGVTAGWVAWYCSPPLAGATPEDMTVELFFHDTPEHAERTYQYFRAEHEMPEDERETIADAVSMITRTPNGSGIIVRQGTVMASVTMQHGEDRDVSAGLRDFARMLARGIDEFIRSQG